MKACFCSLHKAFAIMRIADTGFEELTKLTNCGIAGEKSFLVKIKAFGEGVVQITGILGEMLTP
jgi:hypothetical protein